MALSNVSTWVYAKPSISNPFLRNPKPHFCCSPRQNGLSQHYSTPKVQCGLRELRERIDSVKSTQKITEAMKLVAAAKSV